MDPIQAFLDEIANASASGVAAYESPATAKSTAVQYIERRYGCDKIADHHRHARCMLRGRIAFLKKQRDVERDLQRKRMLQIQINTWEKKFTEELGRSRYRKD